MTPLQVKTTPCSVLLAYAVAIKEPLSPWELAFQGYIHLAMDLLCSIGEEITASTRRTFMIFQVKLDLFAIITKMKDGLNL